MTFSKVDTYTFHIESYQCDLNEKARLAGIINYLLEASTEHAEKRGFGYTSLKMDGRAWVLSRFIIELDHYPANETDLVIKTWVEDVARTFTHRCFSLHDAAGNLIGYAKSIWAAIDVDTRRPVNILDWRPDMNDYIEKGMDCPIENPAKIPLVNSKPHDSFVVKYNDVDVNRHVNSVRYIEHMIDTFDLSFFNHKSIRKFEVIYLAESVFGDRLTIHKEETSSNEYLIEIKNNDVSVCRSLIIWRE